MAEAAHKGRLVVNNAMSFAQGLDRDVGKNNFEALSRDGG